MVVTLIHLLRGLQLTGGPLEDYTGLAIVFADTLSILLRLRRYGLVFGMHGLS
jgi:hypothetical protein